MTAVRWHMKETLEAHFGEGMVDVTYGSATKEARRALKMKKTHSNDAYCMGSFHPKHRAGFMHYEKLRRNNRCLEKFKDAVYIDSRDGSRKKGFEIGCNRTNRKYPRNSELNERIYRQEKVSAGKRIIRKVHYELRPGDIVTYRNERYTVVGMKNLGKAVAIRNEHRTVYPSVKSVKKIKHAGGWRPV